MCKDDSGYISPVKHQNNIEKVTSLLRLRFGFADIVRVYKSYLLTDLLTYLFEAYR